MVFSSITFIYYFLPLVLLFYFITPNKYKNLVLLICSLIFYFYGEQGYILILLFSCFINYISGLLIEKYKSKIVFIITILINIGLLFYFKYTNFFIDNINNIFKFNINFISVVMPIGISFFTFQTLSYVIDVYKGNVKANHNFINFACFVCMFPQLVAGPIVRYKDINKDLESRKHSYDKFGDGVTRFIIGLSKKVIIANVIGNMINLLSSTSILSVILISIGFTLQIYFDFSGYSDMAIGLGKMFGFEFLENFNYPLIASTITDFWRRWHISLSSFFRDYVYIPLGGNKVSSFKHIRNILIVWMITGLWHGASWNFVLWGLYFGIILIIEKYFLLKFLNKHKFIGHIYTIILVIISFVIFNSYSVNIFNLPLVNSEAIYYLKSYLVILMVAVIASTPLFKNIFCILNKKIPKVMDVVWIIICFLLLILVTSFLIDSSFNPFLYFRF